MRRRSAASSASIVGVSPSRPPRIVRAPVERTRRAPDRAARAQDRRSPVNVSPSRSRLVMSSSHVPRTARAVERSSWPSCSRALRVTPGSELADATPSSVRFPASQEASAVTRASEVAPVRSVAVQARMTSSPSGHFAIASRTRASRDRVARAAAASIARSIAGCRFARVTTGGVSSLNVLGRRGNARPRRVRPIARTS